MSQAPGLDLLTRSVPGDGTKGVTIEAAATGDPDRSWMVIDHPFRSFLGGCSPSSVTELKQLADVLGSDSDDLFNANFKISNFINQHFNATSYSIN